MADPLASIRALIERLPRRIEPLGGQRTSYVQLDNVLAILESAVLASVPPPQEEKELARGGTQADSGHLQSSAANDKGLSDGYFLKLIAWMCRKDES